MSFRLKTILGVALIEGVLLAILIGSVFNQLYAFSRQQQDDYARVTLANFATMARDGVLQGDVDRLKAFVGDFGDNPDIVYARILTADGRVLAMSGNLLPPGAGEAAPASWSGMDVIHEVGSDLFSGGNTVGRVELGISMARMGETFERVRQESWLLAGVEMGLVALFSLLLGLYLTRQFKELQVAATRLSQGELGVQVQVRGKDELARTAEAFNAMSRQLLRDQRLEADYKALLQAREEDERQHLEVLVAERTEALVAAGRELQTLVENMPVSIARFDRSGRVVYLSPQFDHSAGVSADLILGRRLEDLAREGNQYAYQLQDVINEILESGHSAEKEVRVDSAQGERIYQVRMAVERDDNGEVGGVLAVGMNITERRRGEARLALMSFAMNQVTEAALLIDEQARIIFANKGAGTTLGYPPEHLIGKNMADLRADFDPERWAAHWRELRDKGSLVYETVNRHRDGREILVEVNATYFEMDGKGYDLALGRDISVRKQLEQARELALGEAERLARAKSEFLANMSHEIRTPLNAVLGMAQLGMRASRGRRVQSQFAAIMDAGQLLLGLVNDILDFSKMDAGRLVLEEGVVDTGELIDRVLELTASRAYAKGLDYALVEAADLPELFPGDPLRLAQVLVNLLSNAIKFTETGGVSLTVTRAGEHLLFTVADTGIGMSEEQIQRLFVPFEQADGSTTRRFGGTGLGLAISKRLVDLMGGEILARGHPGQGMVFSVRLPVAGLPVPRVLGPVGRVWLTGPGCALELAEELPDWGVEVLVGSVKDAVAGEEGPLIFPYSALTHRDSLNQVKLALSAGRRLAVILPPGGVHAIPPEIQERIEPLAWPPRSRHIRRLFEADRHEPLVSPPVRARLKGLRILMAEDNDLNRMILEELLAMEGARVESVENGRLLVERVSRGPEDFDIVVTDVQMPEMDGFEATRQLHQVAPDLPVVGLTAHVLSEERERCLASGMVAHVGKPTQLDVLVRVLLEHSRLPLGGSLPEADASRPVAGPTQRETGCIDWQTLIANFMGREDLVRKGCTLLVENHAGTPAQLRDLAATGRRDDLLMLAHNVKGMAGNLQALEVREQALSLEQALAGGEALTPARAEPLAAAMERLLAEVADRLGVKDFFSS